MTRFASDQLRCRIRAMITSVIVALCIALLVTAIAHAAAMGDTRPLFPLALTLEFFDPVAIIPTILVAFTTLFLSGSASIFTAAKPIDRVGFSY